MNEKTLIIIGSIINHFLLLGTFLVCIGIHINTWLFWFLLPIVVFAEWSIRNFVVKPILTMVFSCRKPEVRQG